MTPLADALIAAGLMLLGVAAWWTLLLVMA